MIHDPSPIFQGQRNKWSRALTVMVRVQGRLKKTPPSPSRDMVNVKLEILRSLLVNMTG